MLPPPMCLRCAAWRCRTVATGTACRPAFSSPLLGVRTSDCSRQLWRLRRSCASRSIRWCERKRYVWRQGTVRAFRARLEREGWLDARGLRALTPRPARRARLPREGRGAVTRIVNVAAAQMGPISKAETRSDTVARLLAMMREAKGRGADLVVFTELALTTFFPRWLIADEAELEAY